jgi:N-acetylglutamate synthase-like GNAT family acetyltransferase
MDFRIRRAESADFAGVDALLQASYPVLMAASYEPSVLASTLPLMVRANPRLLASGTYYVAESNQGMIVGCGGWTAQPPGSEVSTPGIAHLRHFGTHPDWLRRGIGRLIYERCEIDARNAGISQFECNASLNGEPFYAALGFERIALVDVPMGGDVLMPGAHMRRRF